jgi:hypothetical protein
MKLLGILGTQEIIVLLITVLILFAVVLIPVLAFRAGFKKGRKKAA